MTPQGKKFHIPLFFFSLVCFSQCLKLCLAVEAQKMIFYRLKVTFLHLCTFCLNFLLPPFITQRSVLRFSRPLWPVNWELQNAGDHILLFPVCHQLMSPTCSADLVSAGPYETFFPDRKSGSQGAGPTLQDPALMKVELIVENARTTDSVG